MLGPVCPGGLYRLYRLWVLIGRVQAVGLGTFRGTRPINVR